MPNKIDLTGRRFGRLVVLQELYTNHNKKIVWLCRCDCGKELSVVGAELRCGDSKSCGCMKVERATKHRRSKTKEYRVWADMIQRCTNSNCPNYKYYGAKGIRVCDRWLNSFEAFFDDMGERPSKGHSIERDNVYGNYEPGNCRWATREEQDKNTTNNRWIEYDGQKMILCDWAKYFGVHPVALRGYLLTHSFEEAHARYTSEAYKTAKDKRNFKTKHIQRP